MLSWESSAFYTQNKSAEDNGTIFTGNGKTQSSWKNLSQGVRVQRNVQDNNELI